MKTVLLKATTTEGKTEIFNLDRILTFRPYGNGTVQILMGAGLYWTVYADSIQPVDCVNDLLQAVKGDY